MECSICCNSSTNTDFTELDCSHSFHSSCIMEWTSKGHVTCPICRQKFVKEPQQQRSQEVFVLSEDDLHFVLRPLLFGSSTAPPCVRVMLNQYRKKRRHLKKARANLRHHETMSYGNFRELKQQDDSEKENGFQFPRGSQRIGGSKNRVIDI